MDLKKKVDELEDLIDKLLVHCITLKAENRRLRKQLEEQGKRVFL